MRLSIQVDTIDGRSETIETAPIDIVMWERAFKTKVTKPEVMGLEDLAWLAHHAGRRLGLISETRFDAWLASIVALDPGDDQARPTPAVPSVD